MRVEEILSAKQEGLVPLEEKEDEEDSKEDHEAAAPKKSVGPELWKRTALGPVLESFIFLLH